MHRFLICLICVLVCVGCDAYNQAECGILGRTICVRGHDAAEGTWKNARVSSSWSGTTTIKGWRSRFMLTPSGNWREIQGEFSEIQVPTSSVSITYK